MIKLKIKDIEKLLNKKIQTNISCLGIDIASTTGLAYIKTTDQDMFIETAIFKIPTLPRKIANQMIAAEKYEQVLDSICLLLVEYKNKMKFADTENILVIEQSFMQLNVVTFGILRAMQGIAYSTFHSNFKIINIYLATVARKLVGFQSIYSRSDLQHLKSAKRTETKKKEIIKWVNGKLGTQIDNDNIADAAILALAGIING